MTAGTTFTLVGYGRSGDGVNGFTTDASFTVKRSGKNNADAFLADDEGIGPVEVFRYDFDDASGNNNLGGPTLGNDVETTVGGGDSGGPSFIDHGSYLSLAGVNTHSFRFGPPFGPQNPDAPFFNSGGGGMLVPTYASWIDEQVGTYKILGTTGRRRLCNRCKLAGRSPVDVCRHGEIRPQRRLRGDLLQFRSPRIGNARQ